MAAEQTTAGHPPDVSSLCLALTELAPFPMATVEGPAHIVHYVNPAFRRLMQKPAEDLIGKPLSELLPEKDECVSLLDQVSRTGKPQSYTQQEGSKPHPVFWSYTMWPLLEGERLVGVMIQVTETAQFHCKTVEMNQALMLGSVRQHELTEEAEKLNARLRVEIAEREQAEQALRRAQAKLADRAVHLEHIVSERTAELSQTNKQLEAFVYSIAHDLRAPLRSMQGFSTLLAQEAGPTLGETGRDLVNRVRKSAQFMDALVTGLVAFSQMGRQRIELVSLGLQSVVQSAVSHLEKQIQETNANVEIVGPWPAVLAHETTLAQVLFHLVSNALKFVAPGVPPGICLRAEEQSQFVRVWVEDNGIGMAPEHQEQIFRIFNRLHGQTYPGTGLGLAIVQKGIELMGGRLGVESVSGEGSRFWFELRRP